MLGLSSYFYFLGNAAFKQDIHSSTHLDTLSLILYSLPTSLLLLTWFAFLLYIFGCLACGMAGLSGVCL